MRERQIKKQFYLNEKENYMLKNKCERAGISESTFFRKCITNSNIKEKPDNRFYECLENLRGIATNLLKEEEITKLENCLCYMY